MCGHFGKLVCIMGVMGRDADGILEGGKCLLFGLFGGRYYFARMGEP